MARRETTRQRSGPLAGVPALIGTMPRRLRTEMPLLVTTVMVVFVATLVAASLPRLYNRMSDNALVYDVENASIWTRNLNAITLDHIPPGSGDAFAQVGANGDDFLDRQTPAVQHIVMDSNWVTDSPNYVVNDIPGAPQFAFQRFLRFRYQSEIYDNIEMVEGRLPVSREPIAPPCVGDCPERDELLPVFEIAISVETSEQIGLRPGDQVILNPDQTDPQHRSRDLATLRMEIVVEVSGLYVPLNVGERYWFEERRLQRADEVDTGDTLLYYASGLFAPDDYGRLLDLNERATWIYSYRYFVDPQRFDAGTLPQIAADLRNAEFVYAASGGGYAPPGEFFLRTGLTGVFNRFEANRSQAVAALSLVAIGLLSVTVAVTTLLAALVVERRRPIIALMRGRGGSSPQLTANQVVEGIVVSLPPVLVGYVAALLLVNARANTWSFVAAVAAIVVTTAIMVLVSRPWFRRPLREVEEGSPAGRRVSARQVVLEITIVALAIGGVILLRRRGISPEGATGEGTGFDPYLAAVPILLGLATGLAALRLYPIPVRFFSWIAGLRRDVVMFTGLRRVAGQASASRLPLLVILLAVALAVFATVIQRSIDHGQVETTWQNIGADYRIEPPLPGGSLSSQIDVSGVQGIEAISAATVTQTNQVVSDTGRNLGPIRIMMVDTRDYQNVAVDTPADPHFPESMLREQIVTDIGTEVNPIPVIISSHWTAQTRPGTGETFMLRMRGVDYVFVVTEIRDRFHGLPAEEPFIVASRQSITDVNPRLRWLPTMLMIRGGPELERPLQETVRSQSQFARVVSREALYRRVSDAPLTSGVETGFRLSVVLATICASLAAIVALALTAKSRTRDLAYLRTLGLSTRQALALTMVEQLPPVIVAGVVGSLLGAGTALLVAPGINLNAFTGVGLETGLLLDWPPVVLVAGSVVAIVTLAVIAFGLASRSISLSQVLRAGDR